MDLEHEFQLRVVKAEIEECRDIEAMRKLALQTVELLEHQRQWLRDQLLAGRLGQR